MPSAIEAFGFIEHQGYVVCFPKSGSEIHGSHNNKKYMIYLNIARPMAMVERISGST